MNILAERAEYLSEMANEAETKKEEKEYWKEYRQVMIMITGDRNMFRKKPSPTNKPSKSLRRTLLLCSCGTKGLYWSRKKKEYKMGCECHGSRSTRFFNGHMKVNCYCCAVNGSWQTIGELVRFYCKCGNETNWHFSNALARNEWNEIINKGNNDKENKIS